MTEQFPNVTAVAKANVYFDGKVISHTLLDADGGKTTLGVIYPGSYHFDTREPEGMEITDGACRVRLDGSGAWVDYAAGETFEIPGDSSFDIATEGICQYICTFK